MDRNSILALVAGVLLGLIVGWMGRGEYDARNQRTINIDVPGFQYEGNFCEPGGCPK